VRRPTTPALIAGLLVCIVLAGVMGGCAKTAETPQAEPKVAPPVIGEAGVLRAGVDFTHPPFAGREEDREAGIDIDVAAALAERLGLEVELVDVKPSDAATALATGEVDVVLSVPLSAQSLGSVSLAGTYLSDGPAYFIASETTGAAQGAVAGFRPDVVAPNMIAAQTGSQAFWALEEEYGQGAIQAYPTVRDAIGATSEGSATTVVGDAIVVAYIARDFPNVVFARQYAVAIPLGVAVEPDNQALGDAVRAQLDALAADGVLDAIRAKWVGELPRLAVTAEELSGEVATGSAEPSGSTNP